MKPNYEYTCDPQTGICIAKLAIPRGRAYEVPAERRSDEMAKRVKDSAYLGFGLNVQVKNVDSVNRTVHFLASNSSIDRYGDTIQVEGWDLKNYLRNPIILLNHDSRALPIGKAPKTFTDKDGLHSFVEFMDAETYPVADTVYRMVSKGFVNAMSVGFMPLEWEFIIADKEEGDESPWPNIKGRNYTKQELLENSVVSVPANPEALVVGRNFEAAFRAIKVEEAVSEEQPFEFEKGERAYFSVAGNRLKNYGSVSPVDTKDVDAAPFIVTMKEDSLGSPEYLPISAATPRGAALKAVELVKDRPAGEFFVCELAGANSIEEPVYRSLFEIHKKEIADATTMSCNCGKSHGAETCADCSNKAVVPYHAYPLAPSGEAWDASKEMGSTDKSSDWKKMSTIVLDDGSKKGDFKLPHHKGPGAGFKTVRRGVAAALARCNQVKGASASDKAGAKKHLQKHMAQFKKDFDEEVFEREFAQIEAFRDASSCPESVTLQLFNWLMADAPNPTLLSFAKAFNAAKSAEVRQQISADFAKQFPVQERKFSNETANKKLEMAQRKFHAAKTEMDDCYKEFAGHLGACCDSVDSIVAGGGLKDAMQETVASKLKDVHEKAVEVKAETARSQTRLRSHMITAVRCMKAMCDYMGQDTEDDDMDENPAPAMDDSMPDPEPGTEDEHDASFNADDDLDKIFEAIANASEESVEDVLKSIAP